MQMDLITIVGIGAVLIMLVNLFQVISALQILVKGAIIALVAAGKISGLINLGQSLAVTVIVADTIVAVIGLALAVQVKRLTGSLDVKNLATLRR